MECDDLGQLPSIGQGVLSTEESLVLATYVCTILLLILGPSHLFGGLYRRKFGIEPPWYLEKPVYCPILGVLCLAFITALRGHPLVTAKAIRDVCRAKAPIVLLIFSFAYLSISLDISGFFQKAAYYVASISKGNGILLLIYIYVLCSILTYFTSNDIVIISMTPIIMHISDFINISNVIPLLVTQFIAANTASMGLLVGSPTNIILGDAVKLSFLRYWILMLFPTVVAIASTLLMILVVFVWLPSRGNPMQRVLEMQQQSPWNSGEGEGMHDLPTSIEEEEPPAGDSTTKTTLMRAHRTVIAKVIVFAVVLLLLSISSYIDFSLWGISFVSALLMLLIDLAIVHYDQSSKFTFIVQIYHRLPWSIFPFVLCMFLLVNVLTDTGFTGRFAYGMIHIAGNNVVSQSMVFAYMSSILVNICNDLPSTVLWANMMPIFCRRYTKKSFHVVILSLLVGVNPGCYGSVIGALAGLVWSSLIKSSPGAKRLIIPHAIDLTYYGVLVLIPVIMLTSLAISIISTII